MINKVVDPSRRTVEVWCEIPNKPSHTLRAGVFGGLRIVIADSPKGPTVPLSAVQFNEGTRLGSVLVVDEKRIASRREVEGGEIFDGKVQIKRGLHGGEAVIVDGGYGLPDGTQVRLMEEKPR